MKKVKITEGPWFPVEYGGYIIIQDEDHYAGLNILDKKHFPLAENNAQAISALPKLLSEAYSTYLMLRAHPQYMVEDDQEFIDRVEGLEEALEKAGYEF